MTTMTKGPDEARELTLSLIEALSGLAPDSEIWRASLRRARRQDPNVAALLQFTHTHIHHTRGANARRFSLLPFSPLPERPQQRGQRKRLRRYGVRLWLVGSPTADAAPWRTKRA